LWDWESSEPDAIAGLDTLHWAIHSRPGWQQRRIGAELARARSWVEPQLRALGHGTEQQALVCAAYALTIAERACGLAAEHGTWDRVRLDQGQVRELLEEGQRTLDAGTGHAR
jgi:hypothetical protein